MKDFKIDEEYFREMARKSLDTMDSINAKWCQEELERIKAGIAADTNFDCSNCPLPCCDPKTAFLEELKKLLEKYNVDIAVEDGGCNAALYAYFDGEASIDFWCEEITRQGLKDKQYTIYEKE